jgi:hypothetical protein
MITGGIASAHGPCSGGRAQDDHGPAGPLEQPPQAVFIPRDVQVHLAVGSFQIGVCRQAWPAVPRSGDIDDVQVVLPDDAVQVDVDEIQPRRRAPVPEQPRLDVLQRERLLQEGIVVEIDLPDRQIVRGPSIGVHLAEQFRGEWYGSIVPAFPFPAAVSITRPSGDDSFFIFVWHATHLVFWLYCFRLRSDCPMDDGASAMGCNPKAAQSWMHAHDEHLLVVGMIEDADCTPFRLVAFRRRPLSEVPRFLWVPRSHR